MTEIEAELSKDTAAAGMCSRKLLCDMPGLQIRVSWGVAMAATPSGYGNDRSTRPDVEGSGGGHGVWGGNAGWTEGMATLQL